MRALRLLAQNLGLAYRDDDSWRPAGMRLPPETPPQPSAYSGVRALRRLAQILGLIYQDDGTWGPLGLRVPPAGQEAQPPASQDGPTFSVDGQPYGVDDSLRPARPEALRRIPPRAARPGAEEDPVDHSPVIGPPAALPRISGQEHPQPLPFLISQVMGVSVAQAPY